MEANYTFRNVFSSDLDLPKLKIFQSALTMVGPRVATKSFSFYSPEPYCHSPWKIRKPRIINQNHYPKGLSNLFPTNYS